MKIIGSLFLLVFLTDIAFAEKLCVVNENSKIVLEDIENFIKENGLTSSKNITRQFNIYFDTPELHLLNSDLSLNYVGEGYKSKKNKQKFHEKIALNISNITNFYSVKHYNNIKGFEEKHPLLVLVKRKERPKFLSDLKGLGVKYPMRLKEIFKASDIISSIKMEYMGETIGFANVHEILLSGQDQELVRAVIGFNIDNELFTKIPEIKKDVILEYINDKVGCNDNILYKNLFLQMDGEVSYFRALLKYPYLMNLIYSIILTLIGLVIVKVLFWNRMKLV